MLWSMLFFVNLPFRDVVYLAVANYFRSAYKTCDLISLLRFMSD